MLSREKQSLIGISWQSSLYWHHTLDGKTSATNDSSECIMKKEHNWFLYFQTNITLSKCEIYSTYFLASKYSFKKYLQVMIVLQMPSAETSSIYV